MRRDRVFWIKGMDFFSGGLYMAGDGFLGKGWNRKDEEMYRRKKAM